MERKTVPPTDVGDVTGASTKIPVNIEVANDRSQLQINDDRQYVTNIGGTCVPISTAIFRNNPRVSLLAGGVAAIGYGLYKMGYKTGPFSKGCITFDITTEPDKERTVRRRLENGTFLQELREEVKDIIEEHSDILGDLKDFTIISCKEILPNKEKEGDDELKNVEVKDLSPVPQGIVQGVGEILPNKEKEGDDEVKDVELEDSPSIPQGVNIFEAEEILPNKEKEGDDKVKNVEVKDLPPVPQGIVQGVGVDVGGEVPLSTIRVNLKTFGLSLWEFNKRGKVEISLELYKHVINAALSRQFKTGEEASIGFAIEQLGCIADEPSSKCCITFDITIDSNKESRVRDILESETFRHELEKEVKDMKKEPPLGLFHHLHFNTISCKKIYTKAEKGKYISQVAEGKIEALVKEMRQLRMLMISLNNKFDGVVETMQSSKDQEPDTKTPKSFDVHPTRAETVKFTTVPEPASTDL